MGQRGVKPRITVVAVAASATLDALLVAAGRAEGLQASTAKVTLRPHASGIYMADAAEAAATAASDPLGTMAIQMEGTKGDLGGLQFYAAASVNMTVVEEG